MVHVFRNALGISASCIFLTCLILFSSCGDDDVTDTTSPEVSFTNLSDQTEVYNEVSIAVTATDNDGVDKVEVYIDGTLAATLTQSPYEFSWDSNTASDRVHTIKVIVTDKTGNKSQKEISVKVSNILVNLNMASDQLLANENTTEHGYIFLSDENGKVIAYTEYENGKSYQLKNSSFNGSRFFLTELMIRNYNNNNEENWYSLHTYSQMERGKNWVVAKDSAPGQYAGTATLNFINGGDSFYYSLYAGEYKDFYSYSPDNTSQTLKLYTNPSTILIKKFYFDKIQYGVFSNVTVGDNTIDLSKVNKDFASASITLPEDTGAFGMSIFGLPVANNFTQMCYLGWITDYKSATVNVKYPGSDFAGYYWTLFYETQEGSYSTGSTNSSFQIDDNIANDITVAVNDNGITYSANGDFDFFVLDNDFERGSWNYILPKGSNQALPVLEVPDALKPYSIPTFHKPVGHMVYDFDGKKSYDEVKSYIRLSANGWNDLFAFGQTYKIKYFRYSLAGGRKGNPLKRLHGLE